jgi:OOP family OmpA-OmpF porin
MKVKGARSMKYPVLRYAVTALLLSAACPSHAADPYWYTGLGIGYSKVQFFPADFSSGGTYSETQKNYDAGFNGFIGYQFNRNWAAEASYSQIGKFHYMYNNGTNVTQDGIYKVTGWGLSALPTVPLGENFSLYGRFGAFFSQTRFKFDNNKFVPGNTSAETQYSGITVLSGFGAQYFLDDEVGVRVEYENFGTVGSVSDCNVPGATTCTGRSNAKMVSVNVLIKF